VPSQAQRLDTDPADKLDLYCILCHTCRSTSNGDTASTTARFLAADEMALADIVGVVVLCLISIKVFSAYQRSPALNCDVRIVSVMHRPLAGKEISPWFQGSAHQASHPSRSLPSTHVSRIAWRCLIQLPKKTSRIVSAHPTRTSISALRIMSNTTVFSATVLLEPQARPTLGGVHAVRTMCVLCAS
jgi:hypothetical protein